MVRVGGGEKKLSLDPGLDGSPTWGTQSQKRGPSREHAGTLHTSWRGYRRGRRVAHRFFISRQRDRPTRCRRGNGPPRSTGSPMRWKRWARRDAGGVRSWAREHAPGERVTGTEWHDWHARWLTDSSSLGEEIVRPYALSPRARQPLPGLRLVEGNVRGRTGRSVPGVPGLP